MSNQAPIKRQQPRPQGAPRWLEHSPSYGHPNNLEKAMCEISSVTSAIAIGVLGFGNFIPSSARLCCREPEACPLQDCLSSVKFHVSY